MLNFIIKSESFRKQFFLLLLITFVHYPNYLHSGYNFHGYIIDNNHHSISYVYINNITKNIQTISDEFGNFTLPNSSSGGDSILFSRIGYHNFRIQISDSTTNLIINLIPNPVNLDAVTVENNFNKSNSSQNSFLEISKSITSSSMEHRQFFSSIPGAYLKSYGGSAGITTLSMDGAPGRHTKIQIEGFDVTNSQNGQVDISQLPTPFINNIIYNSYQNNPENGQLSDGSIEIKPWQNGNSIAIGTGSHGQWNAHGLLHFQKKNWNFNLLSGKQYNKGNYPAKNPISDKTINRKNNHFTQDFFSLRLNSCFSNSSFLKILYLFSKQERGVAGQIWSPTPESFRNDDLQIFGANYGWINKFGTGQIRMLTRNSKDHYVNKPQDGYPVDSEHKVNTTNMILKQQIILHKYFSPLFIFDIKHDNMMSKDAGEHNRIAYNSTVNLPLKYKLFEFDPNFNYSQSPDLFTEETWNLSSSITIPSRFTKKITFNIGEYFHYPSFNDLYWQPGGNENLKPEFTNNLSLEFIFNIIQQSDLKIMLYQKESENLIQWMPSQSYWLPKNVKNSVRKGGKFIYSFRGDKIPFNCFFNYSYNYSQDKSKGISHNKILRYSPRHSGGINMEFNPGNWKFHYQIQYTGERIALYSWPNDVILPELIEHFVSFAYSWNMNFGKITIVNSIDNLTNERYETIRGYPEPGRVVKFNLIYELKKK